MVSCGVLPFQYEAQRTAGGLTALAGLPAYFEWAVVAGLREFLADEALARPGGQGWTSSQMVLSLVLLNLAGGSCVDDIARLEADAGLCRVMRSIEHHGLARTERRALERRWRKEKTRTFPSASAIRRWLGGFHNEGEEALREVGTAFIPARLDALEALGRASACIAAFVQAKRPRSVATLDMDATLVETQKQQALHCYKKYRAYQPLNTWWAEQELVIHSEFRDGNVPAGFEQRRVLEEALTRLPKGITTVQMRSDTAGYQWDLLRYCEEGRNARFGRIEFAVGVDITDAFKRAVATTPNLTWQLLGADGLQEWAEVCFVPQGMSYTLKGSYRFIAIREPVRQMELFEDDARKPPFPTLGARDDDGRTVLWKLSAVVTNRMQCDAVSVIGWYRERCGKSEHAHDIMKNDLAGGHLPSKLVGANAAWWAVMLLAMNLHSAMKHLVLPDGWTTRRMKAVRLWLINVPARVVEHARSLTLWLGLNDAAGRLLMDARETIHALAQAPAG